MRKLPGHAPDLGIRRNVRALVTRVAALWMLVAAGPALAQLAVPDDYSVDEDDELVVPAPGITANDQIGLGPGPLSAQLVFDVANGVLVLQADGSFSYTPDPEFNGTDTFTYLVDDGLLPSLPATVTITVDPVNDAPTFTSTPVTAVNESALYSYTAAASDIDTGDTLVYSADTLPGWLSFNTTSRVLSGTPGQADVGSHNITLHVTDGTDTVDQSFTITVANVNDAPAAVSDNYATNEDTSLSVNQPSGVLANDTDVDSANLTAVLVDDVDHGELDLNENTGAFEYEPDLNFSGTDTFTYRASDGAAQSNLATVTITVTGVNDPPGFTTTAPTTVNEGTAYTYTAAATDPDGNTLTFSAPTRPAWLTFNAGTRTLSGTPAQAHVGTHDVTIAVSDGTVTIEQDFTITVANVNDAPTFTSTAPTTVNEGAAYTYTATATDEDDDALTFTAPTRPAWLTFNAGTRTLSGTPTQAEVGPHNVTIAVNDGTVTVNQSFTVTVVAVNDPPVFSSTPVTTGTQGVAYAYTAAATDPDLDTLTFSAPVRPAWLTFNAGTRTLSGTPGQAQVGNHNVTIAVNDGTVTVNQSFTISVANVNDAPTFTSTPPATVNEDATYTYVAAATDVDGDTLTYAAPTLPTWLSFNAPTRRISGTPTQDHVGAHNVTMTVSDGTATATQSFTVTVIAVNDAPIATPIPAQVATENVAFSLAAATFFSDPDSTSLSFSATGLPPGLAIDPAGTISGTPTLGASVGAYVVSVTASDGARQTVTTFNLTVLRAGRADLAAAISVSPNPAAINTPVTWTLSVKNNAPLVTVGSVALKAVFTGPVPFTFDPPSSACTVSAQTDRTEIDCVVGPLTGAQEASVSVAGRGTVAGDVTGTLTVSVREPEPIDETPANDTASTTLNLALAISSGPAQQIPIAGARAAAAGDFNGDGFHDLAVATVTGESTLVFLSGPDPANAQKRTLSDVAVRLGDASPGNDVAAADLDGDQDVDIVTANGPGPGNGVFLNTGAGSFVGAPLGTAAEDSRAVAIGDVNGDTFPDIVFANAGADPVYTNQGSAGTFARTDFLGGNDGGVGVVLVNLFGDPLPELVFASSNGTATVYANAAGRFTKALDIVTGPATSVATADFNNDGLADLVFGRAATAQGAVPGNAVYLNTSTGTPSFFAAGTLGASPTVDVLAADFDLDGDADIIAINSTGSHQLYTNVGNATGTFVLHPQQFAAAGALAGAFGQLSVDTRIDLAVIAPTGASIFYNDGAGNLGPGDTGAPTLVLVGQATVDVTVGDPYADAGASATDATDGDLTSKIAVTNPVDTAVIGNYTVTYNVSDLSGNAASPITRTVRVAAKEAAGGGGGGGAIAPIFLLLLAMLAIPARLRPFKFTGDR